MNDTRKLMFRNRLALIRQRLASIHAYLDDVEELLSRIERDTRDPIYLVESDSSDD